MSSSAEAALVTHQDIQAIRDWAQEAKTIPDLAPHMAALNDLAIVFDKQLADMLAHEQLHELAQHMTSSHLRTLQNIARYARHRADELFEGPKREHLREIVQQVTALHVRLTQHDFGKD